MSPNTAPARPPIMKAKMPFLVVRAAIAPVTAPIVIMPSIPMLTTPLLSEKQEPRAAKRSGGVAIKAALIKRPRFWIRKFIIMPPSFW